MKLNIQKLQSGGGFGVLFSAVADPSSNATQAQTSGTSSSSSSKNEDPGILSKEVLNGYHCNYKTYNKLFEYASHTYKLYSITNKALQKRYT